jgi:hypothetical protein
MPQLSSADHGTSPPRVIGAARLQRRLGPGPAQPAGRARRQGCLHRRRRQLHLRRAGRAGEPLSATCSPASAWAGIPRHAVPARHHRLPDRLPRQHPGRRRADCRQHPADRQRLRLHAGRFARLRAGRLRGAVAAVRGHRRQAQAPEARHRLRQGRQGQAAVLRPDGQGLRPSNRPRPPATTCASGCIPPAPPARRRARCTCTRT